MKNKNLNFWNTLKRNEAFTLTEMLIVIALIAMVGTFVTGQIMNRYNRAKAEGTKIQMRQLGVLLDQFKLDCGFYPTTEQSLDALVNKPQGRECKNYDTAGYVKNGKIPKDGFGFDFLYFSDGNTFEIKSLGNDNKEGGDAFDKDLSSKDAE